MVEKDQDQEVSMRLKENRNPEKFQMIDIMMIMMIGDNGEEAIAVVAEMAAAEEDHTTIITMIIGEKMINVIPISTGLKPNNHWEEEGIEAGVNIKIDNMNNADILMIEIEEAMAELVGTKMTIRIKVMMDPTT